LLRRTAEHESRWRSVIDTLLGLPLRRLKRLRHRLRSERPRYPIHDGYNERVAQLRLFRERPVQVVFLGDSNTENGEFQERFEGLRVANNGVRGDTTFGILKRLPDVIAVQAPHVFLMAGINDLGMGVDPAEVLENLTTISTLLAKSGSQVFLQSILYSGNPAISNKDLDYINANLEALADRNAMIRYVDVNCLMSANGAVSKKYSFDGTHMTAEGYKVWWGLIETILDGIYPKESSVELDLPRRKIGRT